MKNSYFDSISKALGLNPINFIEESEDSFIHMCIAGFGAVKGQVSPNKGNKCPESAKMKKRIIMKSKIRTVEHNRKNSDACKLRKRVYLPNGKWVWGRKDTTKY